MATHLDRTFRLPGYYPSPWPVECGGNRRQKAAVGGLHAKGAEPSITTSINGRWNVMMIRRGPAELFMSVTIPSFTWLAPPYGWLQKLDPDTLEVLVESPGLPCGEHVCCGVIAAHANGDIIKVNGCYMQRLNVDCQVVVERKLPVDQAHNCLLILSDGSIVTKDLRLAGQGALTVTRLDPKMLELIGEVLVLPDGSMGRIASDLRPDGEFIYIPGIEYVSRVLVKPKTLAIDWDWSPKYRSEPGTMACHGMAAYLTMRSG